MYLTKKQLLKIAKSLFAKYTIKQMVDYIKYKIKTDARWQYRALQRLVEQQNNQNIRVMNNQQRIKNRGFDKNHRDEFLKYYYNDLELPQHLINKLSSFAEQIFRNLLKDNGQQLLYNIMNKDINYLSRNNLKPQQFPQSNNENNLMQNNKKVEMQKLLNILNEMPLNQGKSFYRQATNMLREISKKCDLKILKTILDRYDYEQLTKILDIMQENKWNYINKSVMESLENKKQKINYLPMFWKFNLFEFIKHINETAKMI